MPATLPVNKYVSGRAPLHAWQCVDLRGADEIVLVQAANGVRLISNPAITPSEFDIGMVVFGVCDVRHRVHEARRAIEVRELELAFERLGILDQLPAGIEQG